MSIVSTVCLAGHSDVFSALPPLRVSHAVALFAFSIEPTRQNNGEQNQLA